MKQITKKRYLHKHKQINKKQLSEPHFYLRDRNVVDFAINLTILFTTHELPDVFICYSSSELRLPNNTVSNRLRTLQ